MYFCCVTCIFLSLCPTAGSLQGMYLLSPPCQDSWRRKEFLELHRCHMHTQVRIHPGASVHNPSLPSGQRHSTLPWRYQQQRKLMLLGHRRVMTPVETFWSVLGLVCPFYTSKQFSYSKQDNKTVELLFFRPSCVFLKRTSLTKVI